MKLGLVLLAGASLFFAGAAQAQIADGGFEQQGAASSVGSSGYCFFYDSSCAAGAWTGSGRSGIAGNGSGGYNGSSPYGSYYAFIQSAGGYQGDFGSISQTFNSTGGAYTLSYAIGSRPGGGSTNYTVSLDGSTIFNGVTTSNMPFTTMSDPLLLASGSHTLTFTTAVADGDNTAFVDNVNLTTAGAVPEPATWAMMMLGFVMIGFGLRRRSKVKTSVRFA